MDALLKHVPEILKAVTDPFSLLALMVLVLGFIGYTIVRRSRTTSGGILPAPVVALAIVALSFLALAFNVLRVTALQNQATQNGIAERYNVQVIFHGKKIHLQPTTVPFQTSSGQLNVGCGETASTTVGWNLPTGARDANVSASWENADNIQGQTQQAVVSGNVATAFGTIRGRDREWLGNCPGGGHGQLVLKGTYVIDQGGPEEEVVLKSYQNLLPPGETVLVPIPLTTEVSLSSCEVTATNDSGRGKLTLTLQRNSDGQFITSDVHREGTLDLRAGIEDGSLKVELPPRS